MEKEREQEPSSLLMAKLGRVRGREKETNSRTKRKDTEKFMALYHEEDHERA